MFLAVKRTITSRHCLAHLGYFQADLTRHHEDNQPSIDIVSAPTKLQAKFDISIVFRHLHQTRCRPPPTSSSP
eukprot:scaffold93029_cov53-Attheya_sp.AAC.4